MYRKKNIFLLWLIFLLCLLFTGCAKEITVEVYDSGETKEITTKTRQTVEEALTEAQITLKDGDTTEPARDSELTEEITNITINRFCAVNIISGEETTELEVLGGKVQDALDQAGIVLEEGQYVQENTQDWLTDSMDIHIIQMLPVVIKADGTKQKVYTEARTVQELLKEQNITVNKKDRVTPELTEQLTAETKTVKIQRVEIKKETETERIPYEKKTVYSDNLNKGTSKVTTAGEEGTKEVTYKVTYVDGKEESREKAEEKITQEPVTEVTSIGTREVVTSKPSPGNSGSSGQSSSSGNGSSSGQSSSSGKTVISKEKVYDCDGSGNGYYVITYSDGTIEYEDF